MEIIREMLGRKKYISPVYLLPILFFAGLWLADTTGIYNDSHQYIAMHIHREPVYPFFLWIFRTLFGEGGYLEIVRFVQNVLAAGSVLYLTACIRREFALKEGMTFLVCALLLSPHVITPLFSESRLVLSDGIISEALVLPFFYFFFAECLYMILERSRRAAGAALALALLLSLTRGQMMTAILLWTAAGICLCAAARHWRGAGVVLLCTALAFGGRTFLVKSYNLAFNGHFINMTFGDVGLLANVLYAADREDGERIADDKAREYFYLSFDLAQEREANYRYAPEGFLNRAAHLERYHDMLKFELIEEPWRAIHDREGFTDYIPENVESDRIAAVIAKSILPGVLGRWFYDYMALSVYGLIRSVAVVHPLLNGYAFLVYALFLLLTGLAFCRDRKSRAARAAAFALLAVLANVYATSLIIMCLSRYMIYGLPVFYIGLLLLLHELVQTRKSVTVQPPIAAV